MKVRNGTLAVLIVVGVCALWFAAADKVWTVETCPQCMFQRESVQYRVFGISLHQRVSSHDTLIGKVAEDIGVPCLHKAIEVTCKQRFYGLLVRVGNRQQGTHRMEADISWYDTSMSNGAKELVQENPQLRAEFTHRVLQNHDWDYWKQLMNQIKLSPPPNPSEAEEKGKGNAEGE